MSPPEDADSDEEDQAKQLQAWLQTDLDESILFYTGLNFAS